MVPPLMNRARSLSTPQMVMAVVGCVVVLFLLHSNSSNSTSYNASSANIRRLYGKTPVFLMPSDSLVARKKRKDLMANDKVQVFVLDSADDDDAMLLKQCDAVERYQEFMKSNQEHFALELYKFCALSDSGGLYLDVDSPLLVSVDEILERKSNVAVQSDYFEDTIHGSILFLKNGFLAERMFKLLMETPIATLQSLPLLIPKTLNNEIKTDLENPWFLYHHHCLMDPLLKKSRKLSSYQAGGNRISHHCPMEAGYCCHVRDVVSETVVLMTKHPLLPYQVLPVKLPQSYKPSKKQNKDDLPFISTVEETVHPKPKDAPRTPNFFDTLLQNNCLPSDLQCNNCLRDKKGADCNTCKHVCPCYCKTLCHVSVDEKHVAKTLSVHPPLYARDPNRLIPRIIHQTWFEDVSKEKYPNMSRLIESFKQSGWEYKFYSDDASRELLATHFPREVLEAYDTLRPGAFKADLFRYCVLLIYGGVYADMDVMLESNLDAAIAPDVGFMVPVDEPGAAVNKRMCLWNGFIAAAPGHEFLARAIETVVNNIRNRFTSVDVDATFCPNPELSVLHAFDTLFTAGPCILGSVVNKALGRHGQTQFEPGPVDTPSSIPGRTIILRQNKWDMGAHRFTLLEQNLVVAATDMPDYDDRGDEKEHYSKTHVKSGIYGLEKLYTDSKKANEDIRIQIVR